MKSNYCLARLNFSIEGQNKTISCINNELSSIKTTNEREQHITFNWVTELPVIPNATTMSPFKISNRSYELNNELGLTYQASVNGKQLNIKLAQSKHKQRFLAHLQPSWLRRFRNWNYLSSDEEVAKGFCLLYTSDAADE